MATATYANTYAKLNDGTWGIRVIGRAESGQTIEVEKKSGEKKRETVDRVLWTRNGISLCSVAHKNHKNISTRIINNTNEFIEEITKIENGIKCQMELEVQENGRGDYGEIRIIARLETPTGGIGLNEPFLAMDREAAHWAIGEVKKEAEKAGIEIIT